MLKSLKFKTKINRSVNNRSIINRSISVRSKNIRQISLSNRVHSLRQPFKFSKQFKAYSSFNNRSLSTSTVEKIPSGLSSSNTTGFFWLSGMMLALLTLKERERTNAEESKKDRSKTGISTEILHDLLKKPWLSNRSNIKEFVTNTKVNVLVLGVEDVLAGESSDSIQILNPERAIQRQLNKNSFSIQVIENKTLTKLGLEELDHILKGELTWGKDPEKRNPISQWFVSWVNDSEYSYNYPNKKDAPKIVLIPNENYMDQEVKNMVIDLSRKEKIPIYLGSSSRMIDWINVNKNIKTDLITEFLDTDNKRNYDKGYDEGYENGKKIGIVLGHRDGHDKGMKEGMDMFHSSEKNNESLVRKAFRKGFRTGFEAAGTHNPLPSIIPSSRSEWRKLKSMVTSGNIYNSSQADRDWRKLKSIMSSDDIYNSSQADLDSINSIPRPPPYNPELGNNPYRPSAPEFGK